MTFPTSAQNLTPVRQDSDGSVSQAVVIPGSPYRVQLGAPASGDVWHMMPAGVYPLVVPAAPTIIGPIVSPRGNLTASSVYQWALSDVTDAGETGTGPSATITGATLGTNTAVTLRLPSLTESTSTNPARYRWLCRTLAGGSSFLRVQRIMREQVYVTDGTPDIELVDAAPTANTSGAIGSVAVSGGGHATWTELAWGSTLAAGQFAVQYDVTASTAGMVQFAAADAGQSITITWTGATVVDETLIGDIMGAVQDTTTQVVTNVNDIASYYGTAPNLNGAHALRTLYADTTAARLIRGRGALVGGGRSVIAPIDTSATAHALAIYDLTGMGLSAFTPPTPTVNTTALPVGFVPQALDTYGRYAVVVGSNATGTNVAVLDVSVPAAPALVGSLALLKEAYDVQVVGRYAVIAANGLAFVVDLATPAAPAIKWQITTGLLARHAPGCVFGLGFVALPYFDLHKVFLVNPATGAIVTTITDTVNANSPAGCAAIDNHLLITNNVDATHIQVALYDLSLWPASITGSPTATFSAGGTGIGFATPVVAMGRYAVIGGQAGSGSLTILDVSAPASPVSVYQAIPTGIAPVTGLGLAGRHLLVSHYQGISVYDLSSKDVDALRAGAVEAGQLLVDGSALVQHRLRAGSAVIGRGGLAVDGDAAVTGVFSVSGQLIDTSTGTGLSVVGGAALGTGGSLVAPALQAGSTPRRGRITWTTGNSPGTDATALTVTLPVAYTGGFVVLVTPVWVAAAGWTIADAGYGTQHGGVGSSLSAWALNIRNALQPNTAYAVDYELSG